MKTGWYILHLHFHQLANFDSIDAIMCTVVDICKIAIQQNVLSILQQISQTHEKIYHFNKENEHMQNTNKNLFSY